MKKKKTVNTVRQSNKRQIALKAGFRSYFEFKIAYLLTRANIRYEYESYKLMYTTKESKCTCKVCGSNEIVSNHVYIPDFYLPDYNIYLEPKGVFDASDRNKMKAINVQHPDKRIFMVFQSKKKKISPKSKYTYESWCRANNLLQIDVDKLIESIVYYKQ